MHVLKYAYICEKTNFNITNNNVSMKMRDDRYDSIPIQMVIL